MRVTFPPATRFPRGVYYALLYIRAREREVEGRKAAFIIPAESSVAREAEVEKFSGSDAAEN